MIRQISTTIVLATSLGLGCQNASILTDEQVESALGEYSTIYEAGVRIRVPRGFEERNFEGFQNPANGCIIMALSLPVAFTDDFVNHAKSLKEGKILERKQVRIDGLRGMLIHQQKTPNVKDPAKSQSSWSLVFGDDDSSRIVSGVYYKDSPAEVRDILRAAVLSARLDDSPPPKPGDRQSFLVSPSGTLKVIESSYKHYLFTEDGEAPPKSAGAPVFCAGNFPLKTDPQRDKRAFAEECLKGDRGVIGFDVHTVNEISLDGIAGYELQAKAVHEKSKHPVVLYCVVLFDENEYVMMSGYCGKDVGEKYLPEFKSIAASFQRKNK